MATRAISIFSFLPPDRIVRSEVRICFQSGPKPDPVLPEPTRCSRVVNDSSWRRRRAFMAGDALFVSLRSLRRRDESGHAGATGTGGCCRVWAGVAWRSVVSVVIEARRSRTNLAADLRVKAVAGEQGVGAAAAGARFFDAQEGGAAPGEEALCGG